MIIAVSHQESKGFENPRNRVEITTDYLDKKKAKKQRRDERGAATYFNLLVFLFFCGAPLRRGCHLARAGGIFLAREGSRDGAPQSGRGPPARAGFIFFAHCCSRVGA